MSTTARFAGTAGADNTDRRIKNGFQAPAYATPTALVIDGLNAHTLIQPAALTGAITYTINVGTSTTPPMVGDTLRMLLVSDGTSRVATFSTGFLPTGTLSVTTAKHAVIDFVFNGTGWLETNRAVSA